MSEFLMFEYERTGHDLYFMRSSRFGQAQRRYRQAMERHTIRAYFWRTAIVALGIFWAGTMVVAGREFHARRVAGYVEQELVSAGLVRRSPRPRIDYHLPSSVTERQISTRIADSTLGVRAIS